VTFLDCWRTGFCVTTIIKIVNNNTNYKQTFGVSLSPKFIRVSLNKTPEFSFWGLNICVDFDLRDSKKREYKQTEKNNISFQEY